MLVSSTFYLDQIPKCIANRVLDLPIYPRLDFLEFMASVSCQLKIKARFTGFFIGENVRFTRDKVHPTISPLPLWP